MMRHDTSVLLAAAAMTMIASSVLAQECAPQWTAFEMQRAAPKSTPAVGRHANFTPINRALFCSAADDQATTVVTISPLMCHAIEMTVATKVDD